MKKSNGLPAPYTYLYGERNAEEDCLVTTVLLAGEALAAQETNTPEAISDAVHALPEGTERPHVLDDFGWLCDIAGTIRQRLAEDPRRSELLTYLAAAFGDGETLKLLFQNLFPDQPARRTLTVDGKPILSEREVEVLFEAAGDHSYEEIGSRLHIARKTVDRHMDNVYRKLGVNKPIQAIARAISLGYLPLSALEVLAYSSKTRMRDFSAFDYYISFPGATPGVEAGNLKPLAAFGLLLLAASGAAGSALGYTPFSARNAACEVDALGEVVRQFEIERSGRACAIAIAPPQAAGCGFTPGNLFVIMSSTPLHGLNRSEIAEYTPDGEFVHAFRGSRDRNARTNQASSLAFLPDGRLLATTDECLLEFREGGAKVRRFANGCGTQVCVPASGLVYLARYSSLGCTVQIFDGGGQLLRTVGGTQAGCEYYGLAVNSHGHVFVNRHGSPTENSFIEVYGADGELLREFQFPSFWRSLLAIDAEECLYAPCIHDTDVKIVSLSGEVIDRIDLAGAMAPSCIAIGKQGHRWVCGQVI